MIDFRPRTCFVFSAIVAAAAGPVGLADVINVPGDWPTIQLAINNSSPGDEIVIADGTYVGSFDTFGNDLTIRSASGDAATVTIVGDDSWTVFVASFETVTLQNLTIQNPGDKGFFVHNQSTVNLEGCHLTLMNGPNTTQGAAIHLRGSSVLAATDCSFTDMTNAGSGGGIGVTDGASATIQDSSFEGITSTNGDGGAIYVGSGELASLSNCNFSRTTAWRDGGAIYIATTGDVSEIASCEFTNCVAEGIGSNLGEGGAIDDNNIAPLTITACTFTSCSGDQRGGAIRSAGAITIVNCDFLSNSLISATIESDGGAVYSESGTLTINDCDFRENSAADAGGAVYSASSYQISGCAFLCNTAANGGALLVGNVNAPEIIDGCFFALNDADGGGAIFSSNALGTGPGISDTTFCGNHIGQIKGGWVDQGGNLISTFCLATPPIDCGTEWPFPSHVCTGDIDTDGIVDVNDLIEMILAWDTANLTVDLNSDGTVDVDDLVVLILNWGPCM